MLGTKFGAPLAFSDARAGDGVVGTSYGFQKRLTFHGATEGAVVAITKNLVAVEIIEAAAAIGSEVYVST